MADPLGVLASIIAVLQLTTSVVQYTRDVNDSNGYKNKLLLELGGAKGFLETLKDLASDVNESDPILQNVRMLQEPLDDYAALMRKMESVLAPAQGLRKLGKAAKWPFEKGDILETFAALERYKSLFALSLHADHLELSRAVKRELDSLRNYQNDEELREISRWLSPLTFSSRHQDIFSKHQEGTGQWLLEDEKFVQWETGQSRLLWCPGVPGAGKTIFSSLVVDHLTATFKDDNIAVLGIYCDYKEFNQQSTSKYLSSLLQQLITQRTPLPEAIKSTYRTHSMKQTYPSFPELLELLSEQMISFQRVYIVVDALDECTEANGVRDELLEGLLQLPNFTSLMVTSRYIPGIENHFQDAVKLPIRAHEDDIHLHIRSCLAKEKTWARRIRLDAVLQSKIANVIVERASGMFLLAQLHISSVVKKHSRKEVEKALKELPEALNSTYDQILQRIDDQGEEDAALAREVLSWLTCARQPLKASMLQQALAIHPQDNTFDEDALIHEETFLAVCAGLVVIDQESSVIHFVHYTTQEYFVSTRRTAFPSSPLNIVTTCLTFLLFEQGIKNDMPELYTYIADNWGHHARESPETSELVDDIVTFVKDKDRLSDCVKHMSTPQSTSKSSMLMQSLHLTAKFDLAMTMKRLLDSDGLDVNAQDEEGRTPLYYAAAADDGAVVELLLGRQDVKIDLQSYFKGTPLHSSIASGQEKVAETLLERGANAEAKDSQGERPIHLAIRLGLVRVLRALLRVGVDLTATTNSGHTPLELMLPIDSKLRQKTAAGLLRKREVVGSLTEYHPCLKLLLDVLTKEDVNRGYMLFEAVKDGRPDVVNILLEKGASLSVQNPTFNQRTPLHWAAEKGFDSILQLLLDYGSDCLVQDSRGFTPLHYAASANREATIKLLLPNMSNLELSAKNGLTALQEAEVHGHTGIYRLLQAWGALHVPLPEQYRIPDHDIEKRHADNFAARWKAQERLRRTLSFKSLSGQVITAEEYQRYSERLILAAGQGDVEGVLLCLSKGVPTTERDDEHSKTALHWAAENGHKDISELLLKWGSSISCQDQYGETPLHYAAENGHTEIVEILLNQGRQDETLDLEMRDDRGRTALRCARDNYHLGPVERILHYWKNGQFNTDPSQGAQIASSPEHMTVQEKDQQGKTLLHWAAEIGDSELWKVLYMLNPDGEALAPDNRGWTPLRYAEKHEDQQLITLVQELESLTSH